jgi:hypothetical protein
MVQHSSNSRKLVMFIYLLIHVCVSVLMSVPKKRRKMVRSSELSFRDTSCMQTALPKDGNGYPTVIEMYLIPAYMTRYYHPSNKYGNKLSMSVSMSISMKTYKLYDDSQ